MQQGLLGRISRSSVLEYHAFGIISEGRKARYHYMICGVQGDFTKGLVADPPRTLWTRELKFRKSPLQFSSIPSYTRASCSWCRPCIGYVQARHKDLHWYWHWRSAFDLYPKPKLVPHLGWIRPRENIWTNNHRLDSKAYRARSNDFMGLEETRRAT